MGDIVRMDTPRAPRRETEDPRGSFALMRSAHMGLVEGLRDLDDGLAVLARADAGLPTQLLVAQSQFDGVRRALAELLAREYLDNPVTSEVIRALRGDLPDGPAS